MRATHRITLAVATVLAVTAGGASTVAQAAPGDSSSTLKPIRTAGPTSGAALSGKTPATALSAALAAAKPRGYAIVHSGSLSSPAGTQVHGSVTCPAPKVVLGGGIFVSSVSTSANLNSSYPSGNGWAGDVNNASASATSFVVYAICGHKPKKYAVVGGTLTTVNAGTQVTNILATCAGGKPLSGGLFSDTFSTLANVNSTIPTTTGWRIDANNASSSTEHVRAYVVCGQLKNNHVVLSASTSNPSGSQTGATATCDTGVPVGGGAFSESASTAVSINTTYPVTPTSWTSYLNNASGATEFFRTYVVCAR